MKNLLLCGLLLTLFVGCNTKDVKNDAEISVEKTGSITVDVSPENEDKAMVKAPDFLLPDLNGNKKSLKDYKGNLIYLDIWATWCGPCIMQIPAMKKLEEKYADRGITFLSVSVDPDEDKEEWLNMIKEYNMSGEHLFAGHDTDFGKDYKVDFIPRFILISPNGDIIMDNAPQAMNPHSQEVNPEVEQIFDLYINNK